MLSRNSKKREYCSDQFSERREEEDEPRSTASFSWSCCCLRNVTAAPTAVTARPNRTNMYDALSYYVLLIFMYIAPWRASLRTHSAHFNRFTQQSNCFSSSRNRIHLNSACLLPDFPAVGRFLPNLYQFSTRFYNWISRRGLKRNVRAGSS